MRTDWPQIMDYKGKRVHMIGIGGSSMSGLALLLLQHGFHVSGSDNLETYTTKHLRDELGVPVAIGHKPENVHGSDLIIYSAAILADNPEREECYRLGIPQLERGPLLGQLMQGYDSSIGVCGTHGKTTTTSMLAQILVSCGKDPTIHIGGNLDFIGGNTRIGQGNTFLAEACEYNGSFLYMHPTAAIILNIDEDHLDFYKDIWAIQNAFGQFLQLIPKTGVAVGNGDDERVVELFKTLSCKKVLFGMKEHCDFTAKNSTENSFGCMSFDFCNGNRILGHVELTVPGSFQQANALAALSMAYALGVEPQAACDALHSFAGAHRRFELTCEIDGVKLYHDYGHNPKEMRNAISVAVKQPHNRVWAVMQPHTYSRVKGLFEEYLTCTEAADITLVTDIYAAREKDPGDICTEMIVAGMTEHGIHAIHTPTFDDTERYLRENWKPGDLVLTMGCGNINQLNDQIWENELQLRKERGE